AGQALVVHYTGVLWEDGKKFDSSWDRDAASGFQIGTGSVVQGWDQGLVGKHVGDRVLLVLPPELGYGEDGTERIPGNATRVFVGDSLRPASRRPPPSAGPPSPARRGHPRSSHVNTEKPEVEFPGGEPPADLEIKDLWEGDGPVAQAGSHVAVHYVGV